MNCILADTPTLMAFSRRLSLLKSLYTEILVSPPVRDEVSENRMSDTRALRCELETGSWIRAWSTTFQQTLGIESPLALGRSAFETVLLARHIGMGCLLEDSLGRLFADQMNVTTLCVLEILEKCKQELLLSEMGPLIREMIVSGISFPPTDVRDLLLKYGEETFTF